MRRIFRIFGIVGLLAILAGCAWLWTPDKSLDELESRYLRSADDYREAAGIRLHVRDSGPKTAPALVMLHGLGSSLHTWENWAKALEKDFRVIRYDLPGYGLTGADPTGVYTTERSVDVLRGFLDVAGIDRAVLIGNSMGGRIAWNFAARYPERVAKLVLISPDGFASAGFEYDTAPEIPTVMHLMKYALPKSFLRASLEPAYADLDKLPEETVTRYHDLILAPGVRGAMIAQMEQLRLVQPEPLLAKIDVPVLLLWGEKDAVIPVSHAQDYLDVLRDARLVTLPDIGHVPHEEAPETSLTPVLGFLSGL